MHLCKQIKKSESEKLSLFVRGLIPSGRAFVFSKEPKTFREALNAARLAVSVQLTANEFVPNSVHALNSGQVLESKLDRVGQARVSLKSVTDIYHSDVYNHNFRQLWTSVIV